jgi:hypothetical protein
VEGELLKDAPLVGPLISLVFMPVTKILEYKVTGTLGNPVAEPVYVPKLLLLPFQPLKILKDVFAPGPVKPKPPPPEGNPPS